MKETIIFLADDDVDDRSFFCEAVEEIDTSIKCYAVKNGAGILDLLAQRRMQPHIIFLDINMPVMNGWDCLQSLKNDPKYDSIPVVLYSTTSQELHVQRALRMGALCLLTKPDNFKRIKEILIEMISGLPNDILERVKSFPEVKWC